MSADSVFLRLLSASFITFGSLGLVVAPPAQSQVGKLMGGKHPVIDGFSFDERNVRPRTITASPDGRHVFVAFAAPNTVFRIDLITRKFEPFVVQPPGGGAEGNHRLTTRLHNPHGLVVTPDGKTLFVSDTERNRILAVDISSGLVEVFAGGVGRGHFDGSVIGKDAQSTKLNQPTGIALSPQGDSLYIADWGLQRVLVVEVATRKIRIFAGGNDKGSHVDVGSARETQLEHPNSIAVSNDSVYIADTGNRRVLRVDLSGRTVESFLDHTEVNPALPLWAPEDLAYSAAQGALYIADSRVHRVLKVVRKGRYKVVLGGSGVGSRIDPFDALKTQSAAPEGVGLASDGSLLVTTGRAFGAMPRVLLVGAQDEFGDYLSRRVQVGREALRAGDPEGYNKVVTELKLLAHSGIETLRSVSGIMRNREALRVLDPDALSEGAAAVGAAKVLPNGIPRMISTWLDAANLPGPTKAWPMKRLRALIALRSVQKTSRAYVAASILEETKQLEP